ncbi:MAG: hypothetical protein FWC89_10625 [Defluviitaleaceae bacterium]|nr:hypothetical protein [Defluviitaleaceae bacterium]
METIKRVLDAKFKLVVIIGLPLLIISIFSVGFTSFSLGRSIFFTEAAVQSITVDVLGDTINDIFEIATLEIETRNASVLSVTPGGFVNPGDVTFILKYDSTVIFGVRDAQSIRMRRVDDVVYVDSSSFRVEVLSTSVRNFERVDTFRSNPFVRLTPAVIDQIFEAQVEYETTAAARLDNERTMEAARRNFVSTFEAIHRSNGLNVVWE